MATRQMRARDLKGLNIYHDSKHGTVMYDVFSKNGYVISTSDVSKLSLNEAAFPLAVLVYFLAQNFKLQPFVCLLLAIVSYFVAKLLFRVLVLYKLPVVKNYQKPAGENLFNKIMGTYDKNRLIVLSILGFLITIVTIIYIFVDKITGFNMYALIAMAAGGLAIGIVGLLAASKKTDETKKTK